MAFISSGSINISQTSQAKVNCLCHALIRPRYHNSRFLGWSVEMQQKLVPPSCAPFLPPFLPPAFHYVLSLPTSLPSFLHGIPLFPPSLSPSRVTSAPSLLTRVTSIPFLSSSFTCYLCSLLPSFNVLPLLSSSFPPSPPLFFPASILYSSSLHHPVLSIPSLLPSCPSLHYTVVPTVASYLLSSNIRSSFSFHSPIVQSVCLPVYLFVSLSFCLFMHFLKMHPLLSFSLPVSLCVYVCVCYLLMHLTFTLTNPLTSVACVTLL